MALTHRYILGKSGTGKSTALLRLLIEDVHKGHGVFYIDPHGEDAQKLLDLIPNERANDVIFFDPSEYTQPINILENVPTTQRSRIAGAIVEAVRNVAGYDDTPTPVLSRVLRHSVIALFDTKDTTLLDIRRLLVSDTFRKVVLSNITDKTTLSFWRDEYEPMTEKEKRDYRASTLNNVDAFIDDPVIRQTIGYPHSVFNMETVLNGKILIASLPQGKLGVEKTRVLGSLLIAMLHSIALRGATTPCSVFIDECHHFGTGSLIEMLSGIRKFGVSITLCHQYLDQLTPPFRYAILGNVGEKIIFQVSIPDATLLERELSVDNLLSSLSVLTPHVARVSRPFEKSVQQEMPPLPQRTGASGRIVAFSRRHYTRSKRSVEGWIDRHS